LSNLHDSSSKHLHAALSLTNGKELLETSSPV